MSTLKVSTIRSNTASTPPTIADTNGVEVGQLCRAWVNFNGTGTVAIRDDFNVSSITDNGTGDYTINFDTAMANANYAVCGCADSASTNGVVLAIRNGTAPTTTAVRVICDRQSAGVSDREYVNVTIFGD